jgi:hypothetical protein
MAKSAWWSGGAANLMWRSQILVKLWRIAPPPAKLGVRRVRPHDRSRTEASPIGIAPPNAPSLDRHVGNLPVRSHCALRRSTQDLAFEASVTLPLNRSKRMAKLAKFTIEPNGDEYLLLIESDDGESLELVASVEQLDLLGEAIDQLLEQEDAEAEDE